MNTRTATKLVFVLVLFIGGCATHPKVYRSPAHVDLVLGGGPDWLGVLGNKVRGADYGISLPVKMLATTPSWRMEEGKNPPLLPGKALSLACRAFAGEFADSAAWKVDSLSIEAYFGTPQDQASPLYDKRYYVVGFMPPEYDYRHDGHYPIWVLMDGTVVLPRADPPEEKNE